ncbi:hypothetical protein AWC38_SpisGene4071 [Stylophora pistillata]|uniref:Uncharacterized protein n=1 Tax=Stylophora pistillata TaxID=50429 RepID=A0A2B4SR69_STYPI|nr:hypothetical protein AWC38_SpisGene4071 [Stylophora pistillata]
MRKLTVVFLVWFLVTALQISRTEDDMGCFPIDVTSSDTVWKKNAPYEIGYPLLYIALVLLTLIRFLCLLISSKETLLEQYENEQKREQTEVESEIDEDEKEYMVAATEPADVTSAEPSILSDSNVFIAEQLVESVELHQPETGASCMVMEMPLTDERRQKKITVPEQLPDMAPVNTTDSFTYHIKLGEVLESKICPESSLGKACVVVAVGAIISYGIYRLVSQIGSTNHGRVPAPLTNQMSNVKWCPLMFFVLPQ